MGALRKLSNVIDGRENNFDLVRLLAALAVMFGHSFWVQPAYGRAEPVLRHTGLEYCGSLAVYTFFLISGMLVTASYVRQRSPLKFVALRIARIYPAYFMCVLLIPLALYPLLRVFGIATDFQASIAWEFFRTNARMFGPVTWHLPGLFENVAIKSAVDASLWTLPLEVKCYVIVLALGLVGLLRKPWMAMAGIAIAAFLFWWFLTRDPYSPIFSKMGDKPTGYSFYPTAFFLIGMALYTARKIVPCGGTIALASAAAYITLRHSLIAQPLLYLALITGALWLIATPLLAKVKIKADYSYGIYLWAFPIQQSIASINPRGDNFVGLAMSIPLTFAMAAMSWHLIERPIIDRLRKWTNPAGQMPGDSRLIISSAK
jgi:peptidoglycan/LPS O-acetylase OafA/YrhL